MQLTITDKLRILDRLKNGDKKDKIMSDYKIVARTLQRIAKSENQIRNDLLSMQPTQKRKRTGRFKEVDAAMEKWFSSAQELKLIITGSQLIKKAKEFVLFSV